MFFIKKITKKDAEAMGLEKVEKEDLGFFWTTTEIINKKKVNVTCSIDKYLASPNFKDFYNMGNMINKYEELERYIRNKK